MEAIEKILQVFEGFRMSPLSIDEYAVKGRAVLKEKILVFTSQNKPIKFSIMGFPMKSTNVRDKVLGVLPDMAEQLTLQNFAEFNRQIKEVYAPGIEIVIASDGFAFSDVLGVEERTVDMYQEVSMDMIGTAPVKIVNLRDFYDHKSSISVLQDKLNSQFGITSEELSTRVLMDPDVNTLYKGMLRFMFEEVANREFPSRNQQEKAAKILTREMMLRNEAYSGLVRSNLGDHIRLSMHPSVNNGVKFSFKLINSPLAHHSAWHATVVLSESGPVQTMHKKDALASGYELIYQNNQPFYFIKQ